jgi:Eukaryotic membrane protein family
MYKSEKSDANQPLDDECVPQQQEQVVADVPIDLSKMKRPDSVENENGEKQVEVEDDNALGFASPHSSISAIGMPIDSAESSYCEDNHKTSHRRSWPAGHNTKRNLKMTRGDSNYSSANDDPPELINEVDNNRSQQYLLQQQQQKQLEERVEELELKLSVLSRLLQQQQQLQQQHGNTTDSKTLFTPIANSPRPVRYHVPPPPPPPPTVCEQHVVRRLDDEGSISVRQELTCDDNEVRNTYRERTTFSPHLESPALTFSKMTRRQQRHPNDSHLVATDTEKGEECHSPVVYPNSTIPHLESPAVIFSESKDDRRRRFNFDATLSQRHSPSEQESTLDDVSNFMDVPKKTNRHKTRNLSLLLLFEGDQEEYDKECHSIAPQLSSMTPAERQWLRPQIQQYLQHQQEHQRELDSAAQNDLSVVDQVDEEAKVLSNHDLTTPRTNHQSSQRGDRRDDSSSCSQDERNIASRSRSQSITDDVNLLRKKVRTKWLEYLNSVQESAPDVDVQMEEFIKVPAAVETIMSFGFFICVDSFLYMFTVLPIRFIWSCLLLVVKIFLPKQGQNPHFQFHRRHLYQLIQVLILFVIYRYVLVPISIGKLYHWIRGQAMIKLYVIIAMVEIFDRLFSSLGQDCLDSMYWNTVSRPRSRRFLVSVVVVLVYSAFHALILFVHVATLNVAMNSADQALLTLLISGNFAEIKSTVFKKYNKAALFKITAQDVCERFKLGLFLSLVLLLNICQGMDQTQFISYMRICGLVWCTEIVADWIKHAFITKFNFLPARVYPEYALLLAGDVTGIGHEGMSLDHSHAVVKRIGFAQIPLLCVMFRLLKEAAKYAKNHHQTLDSNNPLYIRFLLAPFSASTAHRQVVSYLCVWTILLVLKLVLGRLLQAISLEKLYAAPEYSQLTPLFTKATKKKTI